MLLMRRDVGLGPGLHGTVAARGLLALGVARGDRVGVWSPNRFEWVVLQYATARIGAILVNINPASTRTRPSPRRR